MERLKAKSFETVFFFITENLILRKFSFISFKRTFLLSHHAMKVFHAFLITLLYRKQQRKRCFEKNQVFILHKLILYAIKSFFFHFHSLMIYIFSRQITYSQE